MSGWPNFATQGLEQGDCLEIRSGTAHVQVRQLREVPFVSGVAIPVSHCLFPLLQKGWAECFVTLEAAGACQPVPPATAAAEQHPGCDLALGWTLCGSNCAF